MPIMSVFKTTIDEGGIIDNMIGLKKPTGVVDYFRKQRVKRRFIKGYETLKMVDDSLFLQNEIEKLQEASDILRSLMNTNEFSLRVPGKKYPLLSGGYLYLEIRDYRIWVAVRRDEVYDLWRDDILDMSFDVLETFKLDKIEHSHRVYHEMHITCDNAPVVQDLKRLTTIIAHWILFTGDNGDYYRHKLADEHNKLLTDSGIYERDFSSGRKFVDSDKNVRDYLNEKS